MTEGDKGFSRNDAPLDLTSDSRIVITFVDDHSLDNARVEVRAVTPEQIAVAMFYLTRVANALATAREMEAARAQQGKSPLTIARAMPTTRKD